MSGFTRDTKHYGDGLVYEALGSKWGRHHATHCRCGLNWVTEHAEPAGFTVVRSGNGWVALIGPGLTDGVDESTLTANALWEAVTGTPGTQDWYDTVRTVDRSEAAEAERKATNKAIYAERRERAAKAKAEPASEKQLKYLASLVAKAGRDRFDAEFDKAVKGTGIAPPGDGEKTQVALKRMSKAAARKMITALVGL